MRLIDADAMNEELFYEQAEGKDTLITCETAFDMIKDQPTVYNIDKVVEELEKQAENTVLDFMSGGYVAIDKAIEIVKQGGVSDYMCEWKLEDEEANLYLTGCQQRQLIFDGTLKENGYRYCPYCGKKIKIVGD